MTQSILLQAMTEATCGEACWAAREDICRCSCAGRNHGCLRGENGEQPVRTAKIHGRVFQLHAVGTYRQLEQDFPDILYHALTLLERHGQVLRKASAGEIERWPELAAYRDAYRKRQPWDHWQDNPHLLWQRA